MHSASRKLARALLGRRGTAAVAAFLEAGCRPPAADDSAERSRLHTVSSEIEPVRLHVGCGPRVLKGWLNVDFAFEPFEDYLQYYGDRFYPPELRGDRTDFFAIDVTRGLPLPDESVDVVFHEDFLEHISQRDAVGFLADVRRVLVPGGVHRVSTPDLAASMRDHSQFDRGRDGVHFDEWDSHCHLHLLTRSYLSELAKLTGYSDVIISRRDSSIAAGLPREYRPDPTDRPEDGNIFADLIR